MADRCEFNSFCRQKGMEYKAYRDKKHSRYLRCEFSYSKFQQTLVLPDNVDKEKIHAAVNDGVLTIELPKLKPEDKIKTVKVIEVK